MMNRMEPSKEALDLVVDHTQCPLVPVVGRRIIDSPYTLALAIDALCAERVAKVAAQRNRLKEAALAYQELATCYRIGKRPTEKLFKRLERARAALKEVEG